MVLISCSGVMDTSVAYVPEAAGGTRASIWIFIPVQADRLVLVLVWWPQRGCHVKGDPVDERLLIAFSGKVMFQSVTSMADHCSLWEADAFKWNRQ